MKKPVNTFLIGFKAISNFLADKSLLWGEKAVMMLIIALLEEKEIISQKEVIQANRSPSPTTYKNIQQLRAKGYIQTNRANQYYSLSFIELTEKGRITASRLRRQLNEPL